MATYSIVAVARTPQSATGPTLVELGPVSGTLEYTDILDEAGTVTVAVDMDTLQDNIKSRLRDPVGLPMELWVYRDSKVVAAGPLVGGAVDEGIITLDVRGLEFYESYMSIETDKTWAATDLGTILKAVVDDWQAQTFGDYGIDTAATGTVGATRTVEVPGATEAISVYEFMRQQTAEGFDSWVDPDTRDLEVAVTRGSDLSTTVFLERGVTSAAIRFSLAPGLIASEVFATGTGPDIEVPVTTTKSDTTTREAFGRAGAAFAADPVQNATYLGLLAQQYLDERTSVFFVPGPALTPVVGAGVEDFDVGDTVTYTFDAGLGQQTGTYRINKKTVVVADNGQETITVEFV